MKVGDCLIAHVIVDIPAAQVNRPFDYLIPQEWQSLVQLGSRVVVPFGHRKLMGFIVGLSQETDFDGELKAIDSLMDYQPFLNEELLDLSRYLQDDLQVFRISVLQTMLPAQLKVKYQTCIRVLKSLSIEGQGTFEPGTLLDKDWIEQHLSSKSLKTYLEEGYLQIDYGVENQTKKRKKKRVRVLQDTSYYQKEKANINKRAKALERLLDYLSQMDKGQVVDRKSLLDASKTLPSHLEKAEESGWVQVFEEDYYVNPNENRQIERTQARILRPQQEAAYQRVLGSMEKEKNHTFLLEGVTGSGKTEVYLQLIEQAYEKGQGAILLVPEISLTPQMVERVLGRFGQGVAVLHSGLSKQEKFDEWRRIIEGKAQIVVGARSSIFAPLKNIGIIIMDEEHETTYKQGDNPRYHARDVALWRSAYHHCPLILGSATPSLESRARAQIGRYQHLVMTERANQTALPPIDLVDMTEVLGSQSYSEISPPLLDAIREAIDQKEQVVLLLNRRGYATFVQCRECGFVAQCPRCDISLTYHKSQEKLKCHYCDFQTEVFKECPQCQSTYLRQQGSGTQKIEEELKALLPQARVIRMDNDTTRRKGDHERLLTKFGRGEADVLLGTQMIAKGLDFERVTLVGVINADTSLNLPDYRSAEKSFQLLTQVAGRTGRGAYQGRVIVQTYNPQHYVMQLARQHDYQGFYEYEMKRRKIGAYPPYYLSTLLSISSKNQGQAELLAHRIRQDLDQVIRTSGEEILVLGPTQGPIAKIKDHYYYQLLIKYKKRGLLQAKMEEFLDMSQEISKQGLYLTIDHEPLQFM